MRTLFITILLSISVTVYGQVIENITLKDVKTGKDVSLSDFSNKNAIVVIFTSNVCPYAVYYEGRITQLINDYKDKGVQFLLINSHQEVKESADEMKNKITTWGLNVPYLADKEQNAMAAFSARKSPEAFILKPQGNKFSIYYNGAIDNNPQVASDVKNRYLKENIENLLQGKAAVSGGRPIGCMIR